MADLSALDIRLAVTDSPVGDTPEMLRCPQHQDDTTSLAVYADHLHCYGCGFHLATLTGLAFLLHGVWDKETVRRVVKVSEKYTAQSLDAYRERVTVNTQTDPLPAGLAAAYRKLLTSTRADRLRWFSDRGINALSVSRFDLGHDGTRFTIPIFSAQGHLLTVRFRRDDFYGVSFFDPQRGEERGIPKYSGMRGRNGLYLFPEFEIAEALRGNGVGISSSLDYLVVVEGELDAVRLWQEGIPAVSTTNGAGNVHRIPAMLRETFPQINRLFIATDADVPGVDARWQTKQAAKELGFSVSDLEWSAERGKDITEYLLNGHSLEDVEVYGDEHALPLHRD